MKIKLKIDSTTMSGDEARQTAATLRQFADLIDPTTKGAAAAATPSKPATTRTSKADKQPEAPVADATAQPNASQGQEGAQESQDGASSDAAPAERVTVEQIRTKVGELATAGKKALAMAALKELGVEKVTMLPETMFAEYLAKLNAI